MINEIISVIVKRYFRLLWDYKRTFRLPFFIPCYNASIPIYMKNIQTQVHYNVQCWSGRKHDFMSHDKCDGQWTSIWTIFYMKQLCVSIIIAIIVQKRGTVKKNSYSRIIRWKMSLNGKINLMRKATDFLGSFLRYLKQLKCIKLVKFNLNQLIW